MEKVCVCVWAPGEWFLLHSPPGPRSSCGLSRLWRTGRFLFHSGRCHSSRWNIWNGQKKHLSNSILLTGTLCMGMVYFLLVGDFHGVWVSYSVGVICQHLLWTIVWPQIKLWVLWVVVALWDDTAADSRLIVGLKVNVVYLPFKLHRQRPGWPSVDKTWPVTYQNKGIIWFSSFMTCLYFRVQTVCTSVTSIPSNTRGR